MKSTPSVMPHTIDIDRYWLTYSKPISYNCIAYALYFSNSGVFTPNNFTFAKKVFYSNIKFIFQTNLMASILNKKTTYLMGRRNSKTSHELLLSPDQYQYRKSRVWLAIPASWSLFLPKETKIQHQLMPEHL